MADTQNVSTAGDDVGAPLEVKKPVSDFRLFGSEGEETVNAKAETAQTSGDAEVDDPDGEDEAEHEDRSEPVKKRRRGGFQKKISLLEAKIAELEARNASKSDQNTEPAKNAEKPKLDSFASYDEYVEALTDWKADQAADRKLKERDSQSKASNERQELAAKVSNYDKQVAEARAKYDDFDDVVSDVSNPSPNMAHALLDSEIGAEVSYYLAQNADLYEKLNKLPPVQLVREIGRIEERLMSKTQNATAEKPKTTKAPAPITPVGGSKKSGVFDRENSSYEEYKEWRKKQA